MGKGISMKAGKPTELSKEQLKRRLENAAMHLDRTKDTKSVYFSDRGMRLTYDESVGFALVATNFHTHCFHRIVSGGESRPYLYIKQVVDYALDPENDCHVEDGKGNVIGYSYRRLAEVLEKKEEKNPYLIVNYTGWWLDNITAPLFSIAENKRSMFLTYFNFLHNVACHDIFLAEHKDGMTNREYVNACIAKVQEYLADMQEDEMFPALSDEERMKAETEAMEAMENDETLKNTEKGE